MLLQSWPLNSECLTYPGWWAWGMDQFLLIDNINILSLSSLCRYFFAYAFLKFFTNRTWYGHFDTARCLWSRTIRFFHVFYRFREHYSRNVLLQRPNPPRIMQILFTLYYVSFVVDLWGLYVAHLRFYLIGSYLMPCCSDVSFRISSLNSCPFELFERIIMLNMIVNK